MTGKETCKILKEIRAKIAEANEIPWVIEDCPYEGECRGTCPKCEAEVRYLEQELSKRRQLGKSVAVAGVAAALMVGMSGCDLGDLMPAQQPLAGDVELVETDPTKGIIELPIEGKVPEPTETALQGEPYPYIMGDVALEETAP